MVAPTGDQLFYRNTFKASADALKACPSVGGSVPPALGPRSLQWWYSESLTQSLGLSNFFMQNTLSEYNAGNTPDWVKQDIIEDTYVAENTPAISFSNSASVLLNNFPGFTKYAFIKYDPALFSEYSKIYLHIFLLDFFMYQGIPGIEYTFEVYPISNNWVPAVTNWNNQPAIDSILFSRTYVTGYGFSALSLFPINKYIDIPIPDKYLTPWGVCVKISSGNKFAQFRFMSKQAVNVPSIII